MKKQTLEEQISRIKEMMRINEETELNEIGMMWLTKIKVNLTEPRSDDEKMEITKNMQSNFNGRISVEFEPGEWYDRNGKIDDIDAYEDDVNNNLYGELGSHDNRMKIRDRVLKNKRNTPDDSPHHYEYEK